MAFDWAGWALKVGSMGAGVTLALLAALVYFQEKLIYVPRLPGMPAAYQFFPAEFGLEHEDVWLSVPDGVRLHAWFMWLKGLTPEQRRRRPTVVFFQENAGNMSYRLHFLGPLADLLQVNVFILGYRGYGESGGAPSQRGFQMDAEVALQHVAARADVDPAKLVVFGRSIGGAVALHAAAATTVKIAGLIIENTFTSLEDIVPLKIPFLGFLIGPNRCANWLLRSRWDNVSAAKHLTGTPILFLSSLRDEMLPPSQMQRLYALHGRTPWRMLTFPQATHMDAYIVARREYWPALQAFFYDLFAGQADNRPRGDAPGTQTGSSGHGVAPDWDSDTSNTPSDWEAVPRPGE
uniref:Serine aminopeptidase S33 domain-containing protein n=1 Tax=Auxenochlorella protothecoides TaxID=3075 RepID=A0A1D2A9I7_AUXPR